MQTSRRHVLAYTLIEVLVVVTITATAGAIVVPQILESSNMSTQAAVRLVVADVLFAQNDAVANQRQRQVVFDVDNNSYRLTDQNGDDLQVNWKGGGQYVVSLDEDSRFAGVQLENIDFGGTTTLSFDDLGAPIAGGSVELTSPTLRYRINITPFTGRLTIDAIDDN